jgi:hypothetical protein
MDHERRLRAGRPDIGNAQPCAETETAGLADRKAMKLKQITNGGTATVTSGPVAMIDGPDGCRSAGASRRYSRGLTHG